MGVNIGKTSAGSNASPTQGLIPAMIKQDSINQVNAANPNAAVSAPATAGAATAGAPSTPTAQDAWNNLTDQYMQFALSPAARVAGGLSNLAVDPSVLTYANMKNGVLNGNKTADIGPIHITGASGADLISGIGNLSKGFMQGYQGATGGASLTDIINARQQAQSYKNEQELKQQQLQQGKAGIQKGYLENMQQSGVNAALDTYQKSAAAYKKTGDPTADYALLTEYGRTLLNPTQRATADPAQIEGAMNPMMRNLMIKLETSITGDHKFSLDPTTRQQLFDGIVENTNPYILQGTSIKDTYLKNGIPVSYDPFENLTAPKGYQIDPNTRTISKIATQEKQAKAEPIYKDEASGKTHTASELKKIDPDGYAAGYYEKDKVK